jgi:hypothetical protein
VWRLPARVGRRRVSSVAAIEVYPAATLTALGVAHRGYKDDPALRAQVLRDLPGLEVPHELRAACVATSDALDAVVAALAGVHFLEGRCHQPAEDPDLVRREGWIWVLAPS